jgi:hypothetical protein
MPPMSQFDAQATPMWRLFNSTPDLSPYTAKAENIAPSTLNTASADGASVSAALDFSVEDRAPAGMLNRLIWGSVKGTHHPYPVSHYTVLGNDKD